MTDAQRYQATREWFERLVSRPPDERAAALLEIPDEAVRDDVAALLEADDDPREVEPLRPPPPERVGTFRVVRELGRGGMGVVYEAEEHAPRRRVALKLLHPWLRSPALDDLARREAQALADAPHPGIPSVYALFDDERGPVVIMELVEGVPFAEGLVGRPLADRLELLARVADAVAYAHARGVVHRDLKPQNLILSTGDQPKVLDFGLAQTRAGPEARGGGTPAYMAPEQGRGEPATPAADLYSLGVLSRELLGDGARREDVDAVLKRATSAAPADRYPDVVSFAAELRRAAANLPVAALPGWKPRARAALRRHPRAWIGLVILALGLALSPRAPGALADARAAWTLRQLRAEADRGDPTVDEHLRGFLRDPAFLGSPASAEGWAWAAERAGTPEARLEALAAAWVYTPDPAPDLRAAVAAALRDADRKDAAELVTATGEDPFTTPQTGRLATVLRALSAATPTDSTLAYPPLDPEGAWTNDGLTLQGPGGASWALPHQAADVALVRGHDGATVGVAAVRFGAAGLYALGSPIRPWSPGSLAQALPVRRLDARDLDGDGADELVAAVTGWAGHELRLYAADARLLARTRLATWDVAITRDGTIWALGGPVPATPAPKGERRALVPLRWDGHVLTPGPTISLDREADAVYAADLDGDGADELVLPRLDGFGIWAGADVTWIPGWSVCRRLQADADSELELRVGQAGSTDWILGAGTEHLPVSGLTPPALDVPAALPAPRLADAWARAATLASLDAAEPVLDRLLDLARAAGPSAELRRATLDLVLPQQDTPRAGLARFVSALVALDPSTPIDEATRLRLRETHPLDPGEILALPAATDSLGFTTPLPGWLDVGRPGTVHREPLGGTLRLEATPGDGLLLRARLLPTGDTLCVDSRLSLAELDWSAGLVFALTDGEKEATTKLSRTGGGPREGHRLMLAGPGVASGSGAALTLGDHRVSLCLTSAPSFASARLDDAPRHLSRLDLPSLERPLDLEVRAVPTDTPDTSRRIRVDLVTIELRGATFDRSRVATSPARTFAETGTGADDPLGRALEAASAGGDLRRVAATLSEGDLRWLIRHDAARWAPTAAAVLGDRFPAAFAGAWDVPAHYRDPWAAAALRNDALRGMPTSTPALGQLALRRAEVLIDARELGEARALLEALPLDAAEVVAIRARLAQRSGHGEEVLALLREAMARSPAPEAIRDAFADDAELGPLVASEPAAPLLVP